MVDVSGREIGAAERRIANIANHLSPLPSTSPPPSIVLPATASTGSMVRCRREKRRGGRPATSPERSTPTLYMRKRSAKGLRREPKLSVVVGDQALRRPDGFADFENFGRLNVLDLQIGPKKAREMWFLCRFYDAYEAEKMGLVNVVVPLEKLELETLKWCREILRNSPTAIRILKSALNAVDDGHSGLQELGGNATLVFYGTEEADEGKRAHMDRRQPDFSKFPPRP